MNASTAGKGTPYWYEWTIGLLKVVEMLHPESGITSVSFQETGIKVGMMWLCAMPTDKRNTFRSNILVPETILHLDRSPAMMRMAFVCCRAFMIHGERCDYPLPQRNVSFSQIVKPVNEHIRATAVIRICHLVKCRGTKAKSAGRFCRPA